LNEIVAHYDLLPTILAIAGDAQVTNKLLTGYKVGDMTYGEVNAVNTDIDVSGRSYPAVGRMSAFGTKRTFSNC
jgi:hypothetical protein